MISIHALSPGLLRCATILLTALLASACGSDGTGPDDGSNGGLTISPNAATLKYPGDTLRLALGGGSTGTPIWTSSSTDVATVSAQGLVTALGYGRTTILASLDGREATASLRVAGDTTLAFLRGSWTTTDEVAPPGLDGTGRLVVALDQGALRGVWRGTMDGAPVEVVTLMARRGNGWTAARADGVRGTFAVMDGSIEPGRVELHSGVRLGAGRRERTVLDGFTSSGFRWSVETSDDDGATWTTVWRQLLSPAGSAVPPAPMETRSPACADASYEQFDFWVGDWTVTVPSGGTAGSNLIHPIAGCGIQENWRDAQSGGGISLNMYDPRMDGWTQFYVASTGGSIELAGHLNGDAMVLEGISGSTADRVTWSPLDDGRVRQHWERGSVNGGMSTYFDGYYRRR